MDYYAFGGTLSSYVNGNTVDKYKFTGKERDLETGLDYFGARYYDSRICRWMSVDPRAELRPGLSTYNYCQNNPLSRIDRDGKLDNDNNDGNKKKDEQKKESNEGNGKTATYSFTHRPVLLSEGGGRLGGQYTLDVTVTSNNDQVIVMVSASANASSLGDVSFYGSVELMTNDVSLSSKSLQKNDGPAIGDPNKSFVGEASFNIPKLQLGDGRSMGLNIPLGLRLTTGYSVQFPEGSAYPEPHTFSDNIRIR